MTDTPVRIWACMGGPMVGMFVSGGNNGGWPEYVRADTVQAQIDAAVAAERERCAKVANAHLVSSSFGSDHPVRVVYSEFIAAAILKGDQP